MGLWEAMTHVVTLGGKELSWVFFMCPKELTLTLTQTIRLELIVTEYKPATLA